MPTYPYACTACDHRFEQVQAFSDPSLTECPECGGRLRKVFSSVGIVFKGSGWYRNDSRSSASSTSGSSEKSDTSDSGSSEKADKPAATKTETSGEKPAAAKTEKSGATSGSSSGSSGGTGSTATSSA